MREGALMVLDHKQIENLKLFSDLIEERLRASNLSEKDRETIVTLHKKLLGNNASEVSKSAVASCLSQFYLSIDAKDEHGETALMRAVRSNQHDLIKLLKALGADINLKDSYEETPMMIAIQESPLNTKTVELLVNLGADLNAENSFQETALIMATEKNNASLIFFLKQALMSDNPEALKFETSSPSLTKIAEPSLSTISVISKTEKFKALLEQSSLSTQDEKLMNELLSSDIDPNMRLGPDKVPALIFALRNKNLQAAKLLITLGANPACLSEKHPPKNESILFSIEVKIAGLNMFADTEYIISDTDREIIHFLCDNGVDLNVGSIKDSEEITPIASAIRLRNTPFLKVLHDFARIKNITLAKMLSRHTNSEIKKRLETAKIVKDAGHVLGFTALIANNRSTGFDDNESFPLLRGYIEAYVQQNSDSLLAKHFNQENSEIKAALDLAIQWQEADGEITHQQFLDHYEKGKITILPVSAALHSFTLIACNDLLIVCNRGGAKLDEPISVFKIPDPGKITKAFLESVIPENRKPYLNDAVNSINKFVDIENNPPLMTFESHAQKHGTCTFVNIKAALQPLLFLSELCARSPIPAEGGPDSGFLVLNKITFAKDFSEIQNEVQQAYKAFTEDMRNQKVNELCEAFQTLELDPEKKAVYLAIFRAVLKEHHGQMSSIRHNGKRKLKIENEKIRAEQILSILAPTDKHAILTEILSIYDKDPKGSIQTKAWLKAQDEVPAEPFTPLRIRINPSEEKLKETTKPRSNPSIT